MDSKKSLCLLAFIISAASSSEYSGLLNRLYKKAASENRPLILVLDNSLKEDVESPRSVNLPQDLKLEIDRNVPMSLIELLNQKRHQINVEHKQSLPIDISVPEERDVEPSYQQNDMQRLIYKLQKERDQRKERRQRRERKNRAQEREEEQVRGHENQVDEEQQVQIQERKRERQINRYQKKQDQDKEDETERGTEKRTLRTSVIKNLLRTFNNLNCDAKDECADECGDRYNGKKRNDCENKCETKYDCEESEQEDPCEEKNGCDDSDETGSTKGERLVTVTEKCKRC